MEIKICALSEPLGAMHRRNAWDSGEPRFMRQLSSMC